MSDRLIPDREAEIRARWEHIPGDEQPRIAVTNSSRAGSLLNALGHARHDVPALLAELDAVRAERDEARAQVGRMGSVFTYASFKPYHRGWNAAVAAVKKARDKDGAR